VLVEEVLVPALALTNVDKNHGGGQALYGPVFGPTYINGVLLPWTSVDFRLFEK
jgi:hypothetical protein